MKKTIGGDRLGAGHKMETELHNYGRSTHNLTRSWRSSMAPGILYPFIVEPTLNGDTFDIDLNALARTIPTQGPLMGSFKLQLDVFQCPIRLYQGILHNNPINIGLKMKEVKLPTIKMETMSNRENVEFKTSQIAGNALMRYLGLSGIAHDDTPETQIEREFNAVPVIAYYDIFKNYYANKQEENAYVITSTDIIEGEVEQGGISIPAKNEKSEKVELQFEYEYNYEDIQHAAIVSGHLLTMLTPVQIYGYNLSDENVIITIKPTTQHMPYFKAKFGTDILKMSLKEATERGEKGGTFEKFVQDVTNFEYGVEFKFGPAFNSFFTIQFDIINQNVNSSRLTLKSFPLENIDKMRQYILSQNQIEQKVCLVAGSGANLDTPSFSNGNVWLLPYNVNNAKTLAGTCYSAYKHNGLVVKTYQADLFNAWINTEWIDGENGIAAVTTVDTTNGLVLDALNLAQKVYNMLNRIAVSGGTYQDWQEAVYTQNAIRHAETPIYLGGMSSEIVFEEVISNAATENQPLGTIAGRGNLAGKKGGHIIVKTNEPSFIMGIVSITPRIDYCEGNKWFMTDVFSIDDFHKPALDGIGFQNLMVEQMAWWDAHYTHSGEIATLERSSAGKVPAWINYMTAFNEAFGDFAEPAGTNWMILARNYEVHQEEDASGNITTSVGDVTTYIDPTKFNYAFATTELDASNFWVQIVSHITARRLMSAKIIPNL